MRASTPWVILDVPHGWTAWTRRTLVGADEVVIVAEPDLANLRNAKNIIDNIRNARPHDHPPRLVLNNVGLPKRPGDPGRGFRQGDRDRADRGDRRTTPSCSARPPTTGR